MNINGLAKIAWALLFMILFFGVWTFVILGAHALVLALIYWLKPEWLDKYC